MYAMNFDTSALIKKARISSGLTQDLFCAQLGKAQGTVSKYEHGLHQPPAAVIIRCIRFINEADQRDMNIDDDFFQLLKKLQQFDGKKMAAKRAALHAMIDALLLV